MGYKMRVESAHIKGYRLFEDEVISFDESTTIIVHSIMYRDIDILIIQMLH